MVQVPDCYSQLHFVLESLNIKIIVGPIAGLGPSILSNKSANIIISTYIPLYFRRLLCKQHVTLIEQWLFSFGLKLNNKTTQPGNSRGTGYWCAAVQLRSILFNAKINTITSSRIVLFLFTVLLLMLTQWHFLTLCDRRMGLFTGFTVAL